MSGLDIDTRSDIYSLGVLLYELLTGRTPFDAKELLQSGLDEMRRTIREKEPLWPSTRLRTMMDARTDGRRQASRQPRRPSWFISCAGDLDWVVMKALEKDRTRRYETANGLAMDVQRFLKNEVVEARPPSSFTGSRSWCGGTGWCSPPRALSPRRWSSGSGCRSICSSRRRRPSDGRWAAEKQEAALRQQAEAGLALEKRMHEMDKIGEKIRTRVSCSAGGNSRRPKI